MPLAPSDRINQLDHIEKEIATAVHAASQAILELSKEKPSVKQAETFSTTFLKSLENVESGLSKHIAYLIQVSTGNYHEGSSYASTKMMQMAVHRLKHAQIRMNDLDRLKNQHAQENNKRFGAVIKTEPES